MAQEQKDMTGVLFRNDRKTQPNHPEYTGNCTIDGKPFWINAWLKEGKNGKFFSFSFRARDEQDQRTSAKNDDDTPF